MVRQGSLDSRAKLDGAADGLRATPLVHASVASWPRVSRSVRSVDLLRFIQPRQKGISGVGNFVHRWGANASLHPSGRNDAIDSAVHDLVALACRGFEPRSVNLDQAAPIGSDGMRLPELVHDMRHGRSTYSKQLRESLLRQRQEIAVHSILDVEQPAGQPSLNRMQSIASGHVLELRQ
jgi:hypothetical protein